MSRHIRPQNTSHRRARIDLIREYGQAILIALVLALFIRTFVVQAFKIPSGSMIQTLLIGDHILVNKFIYGVRNPFTRELWIPGATPKRDDVVVFIYPVDREKDFIKRIIGIEGDRIQVIEKKVYVNGELVPEPDGVQHTDPKTLPAGVQPRDNTGPVVVPEGQIFVMGDNRDESYDSRFWGFVPLKDVKGKAFVIYWSCPNVGGIPVIGCIKYGLRNWTEFRSRLARIGDLIH